MDILGSKMAHPCNSGLALRTFSEFCRMKGANRCMKILLAVFLEKIQLGQFDLFRPFCIVGLGMIEIEPSHCYYWILNQSGHDFSVKHLCDEYCMDIM